MHVYYPLLLFSRWKGFFIPPCPGENSLLHLPLCLVFVVNFPSSFPVCYCREKRDLAISQKSREKSLPFYTHGQRRRMGLGRKVHAAQEFLSFSYIARKGTQHTAAMGIQAPPPTQQGCPHCCVTFSTLTTHYFTVLLNLAGLVYQRYCRSRPLHCVCTSHRCTEQWPTSK